MIRKTREPQYQHEVDVADRHGLARFGIMSSHTWRDDPKRLVFVLSRYKFVSKMLSGKASVLEVGCADAFGTRIVQQEVGEVTAADFDPVFLDDAAERMEKDGWPCRLVVHDMLSGPVPGDFDAAYSLDVIEHIPQENEEAFVGNIARSLKPAGVAVIGCPSLQSQEYASRASREGHVNC
ncbi:MAG: class I SAM-dependent methyltransferase, partial [Planctomycetales bacterium]